MKARPTILAAVRLPDGRVVESSGTHNDAIGDAYDCYTYGDWERLTDEQLNAPVYGFTINGEFFDRFAAFVEVHALGINAAPWDASDYEPELATETLWDAICA